MEMREESWNFAKYSGKLNLLALKKFMYTSHLRSFEILLI